MKNLVLVLILFAGVLNAQQVLTLDDALSIALKESYDIKNAKYSLISSQKSLEAVKLGLNSSIDMEFDVPSYYRQLSSQFNTTTGKEEFYEVGATRIESRLSIVQPIIYTNSTISIRGSLYGRDQFSGNQSTQRDYYSNVSIYLNQPLFTFNNQMASLERAEINLKRAERSHTDTEKALIYTVTDNFFKLYQSKKSMEIQREKVKQTEIFYETAANKLKAGLIAEVEALQLEVDLAASRNDLLDAERNYQENMDNFKLLIGVALEDEIDVDASLEFTPVVIDKEQAVKNALEKRADILNAESDIYLQEMNIEETDARTEFKVNLTANYGINKNDDDINALFRDVADNRSAVLTFSVPVLDWGKNSREVEAAEAEYKKLVLTKKNRKQHLENEINRAIGRVQSAEARVKVLSKTVQVAQKSYEISMERFRVGKITSFDLSQVQLKLTDAKLSSLNAIIDYKIAIADLERKSYLKF